MIIRGRNHYPQDIELTVEQSHVALIRHRSAAFVTEINGKEQLIIVGEVERRYHNRRQKSSAVPPEQEKRKSSGRRQQESVDPGFEVELSTPPVFDAIAKSIKQAVAVHHGLQVHRVLLLRVGTIPKTSSGKIQRYACRQGFLDKTLNIIFEN